MSVRVAVVQMTSGQDLAANLAMAGELLVDAARQGARLAVLPENFAFMGKRDQDLLTLREGPEDGPLQDFLRQVARRYGIWLVGGTIPLLARDASKLRAACLVFDDRGRRVARYDKLHLFDVMLVDADEEYNESSAIQPGDHTLVVETPFGNIGVAICYDLRFPELFRAMLSQQPHIIAIPSAFTAATGRAHWEPLLRARAIENLSFVVAAAQGGFHVSGRETWGHSMIVDPWGVILAELPNGAGHVTAELDIGLMRTTRKNFPSLEHRRFHCQL